MAKNEYILDVTRRERKARSKRLRELGSGSSGGGGSTVVEISGSQSGGNTHGHANLSTLDKLQADDADYLYLDQLREGTDEDGNAVWETVREKSKSGWADESGHSETSDYAEEARESQHSVESDHALSADDSTRWNGERFGDWLDQPLRHEDRVQFGEVKSDVIRSAADFLDGLLGSGFKLWMDEDGVAHLTLDRLTVRQTMVVLELLIEKIRSVGGQIVVSAANGRIKSVEEIPAAEPQGTGQYKITFEQENTFVAHDLMRCQTFTGGVLKSYWVEIAAVDGDSVLVDASEFDASLPAEGDECVLMGNTENALRQNLILISATEDGQPRVDVMDGVKGKTFASCLRARFGNLDGIEDDYFPADNQPHGNGLYADNAYLKGTFLLATGEDVKTKFEVTEGKIETAVSGLRQDVALDKGFLSNPSFGDGLSKWSTESETVFWLAGNKWIWANNAMLSKKGDGASVTRDRGRTVVRIKNKYIQQQYGNLNVIPEMITNADGLKEAKPVYLSFYYRCAKAGHLTVEFREVSSEGFAPFQSLHVEDNLSVTDGYKQYTCNGLWNGTGHFRLSFTGDIYLYMLILSTDRVEALTYRYRTLFEQSEKVVRIAAENFDNSGHILESSEIITTSKYNALISEHFNADGSLKNVSGLVTSTTHAFDINQLHARITNVQGTFADYVQIVSFAGMFASAVSDDSNIVKKADIAAFVTKDANGNLESGVRISADQISLEGLVTANQNFKILADGSIEAKNGTFDGYIRSTIKTIAESDAESTTAPYDSFWRGSVYKLRTNLNLRVDISPSGNYDYDEAVCVVLPSSTNYIGSRVILWNGFTGPFTRVAIALQYSAVQCEGGHPIRGFAANVNDSDLPAWGDPTHIQWINGIMELIGVPDTYNGNTICGWCIVSFSAVNYQYKL